MITPSYGLTATERVLPRLALDWTTGLAQSGVDVTRAGVATFVGSNGLIQSASVNTQRVDYSTGTPGLLVEESRENRFRFNASFDLAFTKQGVTLTPNAGTSPDGTNNAILAEETASPRRIFTVTSGSYPLTWPAANPVVCSVFCKGVGATSLVRISSWNEGTGTFDAGVLYNSFTGVFQSTVGTPTSFGVEPFKDGWFRIFVAMTNSSLRSLRIDFPVGNSYVFGAQVEAGTFPTSYIPTTSAAVTRNADVATVTGTNFSDWFNPTEGTMFWQGLIIPLTDTATSFNGFAISDGTNDNEIQLIRRDTTTSDRVARAQIDYLGTAGEGLINSGNGVFTGGVQHKAAIGYKLDNMGFAFDGVLIGTDTAIRVPTVDRLNIGASGAGDFILNGVVSKIFYYPQRLTNAELAAFSK